MTIHVKTAIAVLLCIFSLTGAGIAETKYFENRLTLPDFPNFQVFVEDSSSKKSNGKRWSLSAKPTDKSESYLLVDPKKDLWVTVSLLHTPYGGREPLTTKKFEDEFVSRIAGTTATLSTRKLLNSKYAGSVGYYYLKDKSNKYGTRLLYIPGAPNDNYGDKRAYAVAITFTAASAARAKALTQKVLDGVKVSRKK